MSQSIEDVEFNGRWVDMGSCQSQLSDGYFYSTDFTINFEVNYSMRSIVNFSTMDDWNDISGSIANIQLKNRQYSALPIYENEWQSNTCTGSVNRIGLDHENLQSAEVWTTSSDPNHETNKILAICQLYVLNCDVSSGLLSDPTLWYDAVIVGADIIFNPHKEITPEGGTEELHGGTILLHELGHALGLRHHPGAVESDVMFESIGKGDEKFLSALDEWAIKRLYTLESYQTSSIPGAYFDCTANEGYFESDASFDGNLPVIVDPADQDICYWWGHGMAINGIPDEIGYVPCISGSIELTPDISSPYCSNSNWVLPDLGGSRNSGQRFKLNEINDRGWSANECRYNPLFFTEPYRCWYSKYTLWFSNAVPVPWTGSFEDRTMFLDTVWVQMEKKQEVGYLSSILIDENYMANHDIKFDAEETYALRVGISTSSGDGRSFKYFVQTENIQNTTLDYDVTAININLSDVLVNQAVTVESSNTITINSSSTLEAGTYQINPLLQCYEGPNNRLANPNGVEWEKEEAISQGENVEDELIDQAIDKTAFKIYPNPNNGEFTIVLPAVGVATIAVVNLLGEQVLIATSNDRQVQIDLTNFGKGIYLVKVTQGEKTYRAKVICK